MSNGFNRVLTTYELVSGLAGLSDGKIKRSEGYTRCRSTHILSLTTRAGNVAADKEAFRRFWTSPHAQTRGESATTTNIAALIFPSTAIDFPLSLPSSTRVIKRRVDEQATSETIIDKPTGMRDALRKIYKVKGVRALYKVRDISDRLCLLTDCACSTGERVTSRAAESTMYGRESDLKSSREYYGMMDALRKIYKVEGVRGLYKVSYD
ncbi:hypothetical protein J6590_049080 [Homalodisca vitripennis]|nr:hypothetical protein J6590_049080 [Homalodisca vitripennis]